jgi:hypothetical protein
VTIADSALSPTAAGCWSVTQPKGSEPGRVGKMPKYVTESGYEESEDVRVRVGRNPPAPQALLLVDLADGKTYPLDLKTLPGIDTDPLAELRAAAGKEALKGPRAVRVNAMEFSRDGARRGDAALGRQQGPLDRRGRTRGPRCCRAIV